MLYMMRLNHDPDHPRLGIYRTRKAHAPAIIVSRREDGGVGTELVVSGTCWPAQREQPWGLQIAVGSVGVSLHDPAWEDAGTQPLLPWQEAESDHD